MEKKNSFLFCFDIKRSKIILPYSGKQKTIEGLAGVINIKRKNAHFFRSKRSGGA